MYHTKNVNYFVSYLQNCFRSSAEVGNFLICRKVNLCVDIGSWSANRRQLRFGVSHRRIAALQRLLHLLNITLPRLKHKWKQEMKSCPVHSGKDSRWKPVLGLRAVPEKENLPSDLFLFHSTLPTPRHVMFSQGHTFLTFGWKKNQVGAKSARTERGSQATKFSAGSSVGGGGKLSSTPDVQWGGVPSRQCKTGDPCHNDKDDNTLDPIRPLHWSGTLKRNENYNTTSLENTRACSLYLFGFKASIFFSVASSRWGYRPSSPDLQRENFILLISLDLLSAVRDLRHHELFFPLLGSKHLAVSLHRNFRPKQCWYLSLDRKAVWPKCWKVTDKILPENFQNFLELFHIAAFFYVRVVEMRDRNVMALAIFALVQVRHFFRHCKKFARLF